MAGLRQRAGKKKEGKEKKGFPFVDEEWLYVALLPVDVGPWGGAPALE